MSIYSGFATREIQTNYNKLVTKLMVTLQNHIIELCHKIDKKYYQKYKKLVLKMQKYEQHKFLQPKFSEFIEPLINMPQQFSLKTSQNLSTEKYIKRSKTQLYTVKQVQDENEINIRYQSLSKNNKNKLKDIFFGNQQKKQQKMHKKRSSSQINYTKTYLKDLQKLQNLQHIGDQTFYYNQGVSKLMLPQRKNKMLHKKTIYNRVSNQIKNRCNQKIKKNYLAINSQNLTNRQKQKSNTTKQ